MRNVFKNIHYILFYGNNIISMWKIILSKDSLHIINKSIRIIALKTKSVEHK